MQTTVILLITISLAIASAAIESNFHYEEECAQVKGFCVLQTECPRQVEEQYKELCPSQKAQGAVCCTHISQNDVNCNQLHNECRKSCPKALNLGRRGCGEDESCCVLVK